MLSRSRGPLVKLALSFVLVGTGSASAVESPWTRISNAEVRLLAAGAAGSEAPLRAGIEIRLARGWHTYWRYPGDAGVPPRFDWSGSSNLASVEVRWPAPERIRLDGGLESIGYHGNIVLPLRVYATDPSRTVALRLKLDIGVCEKICIPAEAKISLDIPRGLSAKDTTLDTADTRVPAVSSIGKTGDVAVRSVRLERGKEPRALVEVAVPQGKPFDLFAEGPNDDWALPLPKRLDAGNGRARFAIPIDGAPAGASPTPSKLRLTLVAGGEAIDVIAPLD
jgi:DsbC/DsbD-like thiol-disulfide interchange protein